MAIQIRVPPQFHRTYPKGRPIFPKSVNHSHYMILGPVVFSASRKFQYVSLEIQWGFPFKADMAHPIARFGRWTLAKQHLMHGRSWSLYLSSDTRYAFEEPERAMVRLRDELLSHGV